MNLDRAKQLSNPFYVAIITLALIILISYLVYWDVLPDKKVIYKRIIRFIVYMGIALGALYYYQMVAIEEIYYDKLNITKGRELINGAAENDTAEGINPNFDLDNIEYPQKEIEYPQKEIEHPQKEIEHPQKEIEIEPVLGL